MAGSVPAGSFVGAAGRADVLLLLSILLLAAVAVGAAETGWTRERFVQEATQGNPELAAARAAVERATAAVHGAATAYLPQLSLSSGYTRRKGSSASGAGLGDVDVDVPDPTGDPSVSGGGRGASGGIRETYSVDLNAREALFTGFRRGGELARSSAALDEAVAALDAIGAQVTFDLSSAFAELLFAQADVALAKEILDRRSGNVRLIELRYEAGREHKGSYLRIAAAARQAEFDLSRANRGITVSQQRMARVIGHEESAVLRAAGDFSEALPERPPDLRAIAATVPAHLQALAQTRSAEAAVTVAKSQFYPTVDAVAAVGRRSATFPPEEHSWSTGLNLAFPFFPGGRNWFDYQGAKAEERRARWNASGVEQEAVLTLEQAFVAFQDGAETVEVQKRFLEAAEVRAEIARAQYENGLLSFEDWDLIENDLIATRKALLSTRRDSSLAEARWELARGTVSVR